MSDQQQILVVNAYGDVVKDAKVSRWDEHSVRVSAPGYINRTIVLDFADNTPDLVLLLIDPETAKWPGLEEARTRPCEGLRRAGAALETNFSGMQDIEFTSQQGKLWILQTRTGMRTGRAMVKIAVDLVDEGVIDERTALLRQSPERLAELFHPVLDPNAARDVSAPGLAASPGAPAGAGALRARAAGLGECGARVGAIGAGRALRRPGAVG